MFSLGVCSNLKQKQKAISPLPGPKPESRQSAILPFCEMRNLRIGNWDLCLPSGKCIQNLLHAEHHAVLLGCKDDYRMVPDLK